MQTIVLPGLHDAASDASLRGQRSFIRLTRVQLILLVAAAVGGAIEVTAGGANAAAAVAAAAFAAVLFIRLYLVLNEPARAWYEGRAAAESVKTLAWCYAVGGVPFPRSMPDADVEQLFVDRCREVLATFRNLDTGTSAPQISDSMRALRGEPLDRRRNAYRTGRAAEQQEWYSSKADWNRKRWRAWTGFLVAAEFAGLSAGVLRAVDVIDVDLLGIAAAIAASGAGWLQVRQHEQLRTAYAVAANELGGIVALIEGNSHHGEQAWSQFVHDAEEAISREHTMWKASRGLKLP